MYNKFVCIKDHYQITLLLSATIKVPNKKNRSVWYTVWAYLPKCYNFLKTTPKTGFHGLHKWNDRKRQTWKWAHWVRWISMNKLAIKMIDAKNTKKGKRILSINEFHTKYPHIFQLNKLVDDFDFSLSLSVLLRRWVDQ